jgi:predicted Zn-dependent protease
MRAVLRVLVVSMLAVAWLASCAINPVTRRPEFVVMSAEEERQIGAEEAKRVERSVGFAGDAQLAAYVAQVGQRVAAQSPRTDVHYTFHILDMGEPNAFALPSGDVYVSRGMLVLLNSEDELAGVLGHEVGHVAARHTVQRATAAAPMAIFTSLASGITGLASPTLGEMVGGVGATATGLVVAPYGRDQERQADQLGQQFEAAAGWDPAALSSALLTLQREEALHPSGPDRPSFFDSHPSTPERVQNTADYARTLPRAAADPIGASRADFLRHLDGLVIGPAAAQGVFDGQLFRQPDLGFAVRFPDDWVTGNGPAQVGAASTDGKALVVVQMVADGDDPKLGRQALERAAQISSELPSRTTTINGLPAEQTRVAAQAEHGDVGLDLTWIALGGHVYQITGIAPVPRADALAPTFDAVARSFRPLTPAEKAAFRETHLRLVTARAGETVVAVTARSGTVWNADMVATANGKDTNATFAAGELVKVAISEPYRP